MEEKYKNIAKEARLKVLDMVYKAGSSHIGSNFSVIDIFTVLFEKVDLKKDKIILSAGWKAAAFYYFLAKKRYFPEEWLDTYNQEGSKLIGLTEPGVPGVLFAGGSMQMGLPAAVGFALSKKMKGDYGKVYCICSDGEMAGGMIWESLLIARHHNLNNLVLIIDKNSLQAMGDTKKILDLRNLELKTESFGFASSVVDGHDFRKLADHIFSSPQNHPKCVIAETIKGKGVSFFEGNNLWHYKDIDPVSYDKAKAELTFKQ